MHWIKSYILNIFQGAPKEDVASSDVDLNDFVAMSQRLNERDSMLKREEMKKQICEDLPERFHACIQVCSNNDFLEEVSYFLCCHNPPLIPAEKVGMRRILMRMLVDQGNLYTIEELELIKHLIRHYDLHQ